MLNQIQSKEITNLTINQNIVLPCKQLKNREVKVRKLDSLSAVYRAKRKIKELILFNFNPNLKFLTLTVEDIYNSMDVDWWTKEIEKFIRRLDYWFRKQTRYYNMPKIKSIIIFEPHKKKPSLHAHIVIDMPYIPNKVLNKIWKKGFTHICSM